MDIVYHAALSGKLAAARGGHQPAQCKVAAVFILSPSRTGFHHGAVGAPATMRGNAADRRAAVNDRTSE